MKLKSYKKVGSVGGRNVGVDLYEIIMTGSEDPVIVEVRDCKYLPLLMPPFGVVAVHGRASIPIEVKEALEDGVLSFEGLKWVKEHRRKEVIVRAACAMFDSPKGGIGQLKEAVRTYKSAKRYRIYKMAHGGRTVTDWPVLFGGPEEAAQWAAEKELAKDLGLHEYLVVKDEVTETIVSYL